MIDLLLLNGNIPGRGLQDTAIDEASMISQPDLYRLGREDRRGVRRGLTRIKELLAAGVNVCYA